MGVLACDRLGCENIMCEYVSSTYGYICDECLEELKDCGEQDIRGFMDAQKMTYIKYTYWVDKVDKEFKSRYEDE